ncbi:MAG: DM13 domain-containing protein [Acidimicrobiia bacterium]
MKALIRNPLVVAGGIALLVVGFLLFRPDTLFTDVRVAESLEDAFTTSTPATTSVGGESTAATITTSPPAAAIVDIVSGAFVGIDHRASGTATVYSQDGRYVLRFEDDTDIQNGPDLYVWVLASDSYQGGIPDEYLDLGTLTGNVGGQNYQLPDGFDPEVHRTVLIWCLRFAVPFAAAPLA